MQTIVHQKSIFTLCKEKDYQGIIRRINDKTRPFNINTFDSNGNVTALLLAVRDFDKKLIEFLIEHGANPGVLDKEGNSCLHIAAEYGNLIMVEYFMWQGVNIRNTFGQTPLHLASRYKKLDVLKLLINNNADVNAKDIQGWTPMRVSHQKDQIQNINYLVWSGAICYQLEVITDTTDLEVYKNWRPQSSEYMRELTRILKRKFLGIEVCYYILEWYNSTTVVSLEIELTEQEEYDGDHYSTSVDDDGVEWDHSEDEEDREIRLEKTLTEKEEYFTKQCRFDVLNDNEILDLVVDRSVHSEHREEYLYLEDLWLENN